MDIAEKTQLPAARCLALALVEYRFLFLATVALMFITSIPTVYGHFITPSDKWFSGVIYNIHDTAQYFSWMRESGSRLLIENKLTSEPNDPIFLNLHWWIPGRFAALTGLSIPAVYQLYRLVSIPFVTFTLYAFTAVLFEDRGRRHFAFLLSILTSGFGWVWVVVKQFVGELLYPTDVYTTAGNSFYVMMVSPPQAFALALTLLVMLFALLAVLRRGIVFFRHGRVSGSFPGHGSYL
jgi:hypothetical protein